MPIQLADVQNRKSIGSIAQAFFQKSFISRKFLKDEPHVESNDISASFIKKDTFDRKHFLNFPAKRAFPRIWSKYAIGVRYGIDPTENKNRMYLEMMSLNSKKNYKLLNPRVVIGDAGSYRLLKAPHVHFYVISLAYIQDVKIHETNK